MTTRARRLLGYRVFAGDAAACVDDVARWIASGDGPRWLACLNPHSWVVARDVPAFSAALADADWLVPDGAGVTLASRLLGAGLRGRVTGSDVFEGVSRALDARGGARVYFLGSTPETLAELEVRHRRDFPNVQIVGASSPPFQTAYSAEELEQMAAAIAAARPDVLWVGLGAPKQELLIHQLIDRVPCRFAAAIGAVFDFYAGRVRRSHPAFQRLGLEWLPRLLQQPGRLWRRTFVSAPIFLWHVGLERLRGPREGP